MLAIATTVLSACAIDAPPDHQATSDAIEPLFRSIDDFDRAVRFHPMDKLDPDTVTQLRDSLVFRDGRVQEMDYQLARAALSPRDYIDLMYELGISYDAADPRFAGIAPPHPSAPRPGRDYCAIHGPPVLGAAMPPPMIPDMAALDAAITRGDTPLADLPPNALRAFRDGLGVNSRNEIHSLDYDLLERHLGRETAAELLRMIGGDVEVDYSGMYCASRGSCAPRPGWICIGSSCARP